MKFDTYDSSNPVRAYTAYLLTETQQLSIQCRTGLLNECIRDFKIELILIEH